MSDDVLDLRDLLDRPLSDFPDRPNLPGGKHFYGKLAGLEASRETSEKATPFLRFTGRLTDPGEDVPKDEMAKLREMGFALSDYEFGRKFHITPGAMPFLRRFLVSLGASENVSFVKILALSPDYHPANPETYARAITSQSIENIRGRDVLIKTPMPYGENRVVFLNNVDEIIGIKSRA